MSPEPVNLIEPERYYAFWSAVRLEVSVVVGVLIAELAAIIVLLVLKGR